MVISPDDMGDVHGGIIHHDRKIIGGEPITSQDDQIIQLRIIKFHPALNEILHHSLPFIRREKPNRKGSVWMRHLPVKAGSIIFGFESRLESRLSFCVQFLRSAIATVSPTFSQKFLRRFSIEMDSLGLVKGAFIPIHPQPGHGI